MSSEFDPYRIWLGIPVSEQPANLYRLLGLALFESDDDVISNAADRQMAHVRTFQTGKYSEQSQKLLNELSAARVTLLDKKKKEEYDARLKAEQDSSGGSSMINIGGTVPPQGSFIGGQSSVNLSPPPINAPEGSLLGVDLGLSSSSKKKYGSSDRKAGEKGGKGTSSTSYSSSKRASSKKNNNVGVIAGIVVAAAALIVGLFFLTSSPKKESEEDFDANDISQSEIFEQRQQLTQAPQPKQTKPERPAKPDRKKNRDRIKSTNKADSTSENDFELPPPVGDAPEIPKTETPAEGNKTDSPNAPSGVNSDVPVDLTELASTPGQVKTYSQIEAKPIASSTLLNDPSAKVKAIQLTADNSHLLLGSPDSGKTSVVNLATGDVEYNLISSQTGRFADGASTQDKKTYYLAVNPSKPTLMQYQTDLVSDELISQSEPKDFRPQSFIFRYDSNGQAIKETDSQFNAFLKFKGYQILQIAPPINSDSGLMAVAMTDGLIHIVNVESGADFMRFYPSDSPAPIPVWMKDSIPSDKKEKEKFKDLFRIVKPSVIPTAMEFQSEKYLATGNSQGEAFVWNMEEYMPIEDTTISSLQKVTHVFAARESKTPVVNLRFDSSKQNLYVFWEDGHVGVWNWTSNNLIKKGFVDQKVKYAQVLADKYLLVQNAKGEVSIWSWDTENVKQVGSFKPQTELVVADPEKLLFWATQRGAAEQKLTLYALPSDFAEAIKNPEFARFFKAIVIYSVPEESQWKAKLPKAEAIIDKRLKDLSDDQKKAKICELVDKIPDEVSLEPDLRYALYMACIESMAQLKDKQQTLELVDSITKEFDADKNELKLDAYLLLLKELKTFERIKAANELLNLCEKILPSSSNKGAILEIVKKVRLENYSKEISDRAKSLQKEYSN